MTTFPPEIWKKIAEELTDKDLRLLSGTHPAMFEVAMKTLYRQFQLPFVPAKPYQRSGSMKWLNHLKNPLMATHIRELGLNLHPLDRLLANMRRAGEQVDIVDVLSDLKHVRFLCVCCHSPDVSGPPSKNCLDLIPRLLTNLSGLASLSLRLPAATFSKIATHKTSSLPDLHLKVLRISMTNGYARGGGSCPPEKVVGLIVKSIQSLKSLEFYCWDRVFDMSGFLRGLENLRLPHLKTFGIGILAEASPMPGSTSLNRFLLTHNSTLTELSLTHGLQHRINYTNFYEWYRSCFQGMPLNQALQSLRISSFYLTEYADPPFLSILGSIYSSLTSLTFLSNPLSVYDVEILLKSFTCDQLKSLKLNVIRLDVKLLELLKERCPKLEKMVLKMLYNFDDIREHESRRILFQDALQEWRGDGEQDDWILSPSLDVQYIEAFKCFRRHLGYDKETLTVSDMELFGDKCETCTHENADCLTTIQ